MKKWWKPLLAIPVVAIVSALITVISFTKEVNAFYNDPSHVGFAIPVFSFFLAFALFVVTIIVTVISLSIARKRKKTQKQEELNNM